MCLHFPEEIFFFRGDIPFLFFYNNSISGQQYVRNLILRNPVLRIHTYLFRANLPHLKDRRD
jgi:adenine-specific DNA methylase